MLGQEMSEVLAQVPGLVAECSRHVGPANGILHLRLVLSANELALLPFELAIAPTGFPGAGEFLSMQTVTPVCITREVRRAVPPAITWPSRAKILFAAAAPAGVADVPMKAHLLALLRAINAWIPHHPTRTNAELLGEHLTILPSASLRDIANACQSGEYTHVHILAHGMPMAYGNDRRFGLALHDSGSPAKLDVIDGERLAAALRPHTAAGRRELARPAVVTLCSCDSGNAGGVVGAGASLAHELHAAGIPLVIASQFPLSVTGSVHLCTALYHALLRGDDPRTVLNDVRRQLAALVTSFHDWASLVAYTTLPGDIERQLRVTRREQAERAINAALTHIDAVSRELPAKRNSSTGAGPSLLELDAQIASAEARVHEPMAILKHLQETQARNETEVPGLLAATKKRMAEVYYRAASSAEVPGQRKAGLLESSERALREARQHYLEVFDLRRNFSWALVQAMVLGLAIGREPSSDERKLARLLLQRDERQASIAENLPALRKESSTERDLIELDLVELLCSDAEPPAREEKEKQNIDNAHKHLHDFLARCPRENELHSLRAQLDRYQHFLLDKILEETMDAQQRMMIFGASSKKAMQTRWQNRIRLLTIEDPTTTGYPRTIYELIDSFINELDAYEGAVHR